MDTKVLGKIDSAEFGTVRAYPFMMGIQLGFSLNGGGSAIGDGAQYTINMSSDCEWKDDAERCQTIEESMDWLYNLLNKAKVNHVSELVGKPVEVTINKCNTFTGFRILEEVL